MLAKLRQRGLIVGDLYEGFVERAKPRVSALLTFQGADFKRFDMDVIEPAKIAR
jgi:hypothetical protein